MISRRDSSLALLTIQQQICDDAHLQGDVVDLNIIGAPLAEELDLRGLGHGGGVLPLSH